jgi:uncharacterized protein
MKVLLVLAVVLLGIWFWRSNRDTRLESRQRRRQTKQAPLEMVSCSLCDLHVSMEDAVRGKKGLYCCLDHCQRAEL